MNTSVVKILKSWESSLERYGKLDSWKFSENVSFLSNYLRTHKQERQICNQLRLIRDMAIMPSLNIESMLRYIKAYLEATAPQKDYSVCLLTKRCNGRIKIEGQDARFKSETKKIFEEKLRFKGGSLLRNFDIETENAKDSRKVRRIIEKRMCQAYHRRHKNIDGNLHDNSRRYWMQRATAFQLYNIGQVEHVKYMSRGLSTHWKRVYDPQTGSVVFKKKMAYATREEALAAIANWYETHPEDNRTMQAYECRVCKKWHIGHKSIVLDICQESREIQEVAN